MEDPIATWEGEGGFIARSTQHGMIGTLNQIAWAVQIKSQVEEEFDRVRKVLEYAITKQPAEDVVDIQAVILILEDKRAEVMENEQAGYFIHDWQQLRDQVSRMIVGDPRYEAIKAGRTSRFRLLAIASREAERLDKLEAPAKERARQKKQEEDARRALESARSTNKPGFRP
jgi:pyruvate/oxaloacetate carboxyltransferase